MALLNIWAKKPRNFNRGSSHTGYGPANVLKHELKRRGLRQSPRSMPRPLDIKGSAKFIGNYTGLEINVHTFNQKFDMIGNVVLIKNGLNQVMTDR